MTRAALVRNGFSLVLALAIGGCVSSHEQYPSLERWPAERAALNAKPAEAPPPPSTTPSADVVAKLARLVDQAHATHADFAQKQAEAERAIAAAGPTGSDAWARASTALAQVETANAPVVDALAQIDQMEVDNRTSTVGIENADTAAIVKARDEVSAIADDQAAAIGRLRGRLN